MITKPQALKDSHHSCAWFVLIASISYAGIKPALGADIPVSTFEAGGATLNSAPAIGEAIPADNPIGAILLNKQHPLLLRADFSRVSDFVSQIYQNSHFQPIWLTANRSEKNLNDLLSTLNNGPSDALNPANYDVDRLKGFIDDKNPDTDTTASYDIALTVSLVRYLNDLRQGQVSPRDIQYPVHFVPKPFLDVAGLLKKHLSTETLTELIPLFEPNARQYQQLKQILNGLRQLSHETDSDELKPSKVLRPGDRQRQISSLRKHRERIVQIELSMERARWIPDTTDSPMIVVNIPAFELWAFKSADDQNPLNMKVIVGKSQDNQTPVLLEEIKYLEFMPYWNIPKNIFDKEIRPKAANDIGYLASHDIELVHHQNSEERGGGGYVRARQRPGKKNPLGRVKFVFPNTADVYLHDTPGRAAFNRPRRDLSHGCVRVAEPEQLAEFLLGDQAGWDKETIKQAMSAKKTHHVTLKRAVPVLFYYATTYVDHENQLRFYPDVYGQDEQLKKALNKMQTPTKVNTSQNNQLAVSKTTESAVNP